MRRVGGLLFLFILYALTDHARVGMTIAEVLENIRVFKRD